MTNRGINWESMGELSRASRDYTAAFELSPSDAYLPYRMAILEHQRQNFDAADRHYMDALRLDPKHEDALARACRMWVHQTREPKKAKPYAERLTKLRPDDAEAWLLLANIHHSLGDPLVYVSGQRFLDLAQPEDPRWKNSIQIIRRFYEENPPPSL